MSIELVINFGRGQPFGSLEEAIAAAEQAKDDPVISDIQVYDFSKPFGNQCELCLSKDKGVWENLTFHMKNKV
jgi:hypothetical protein